MSSTSWPPTPEWVTPNPASPDPVSTPGEPPVIEPPLYRDVTPRVIKVASPSAGSDWSVRVEGGFIWHLQAVNFLFTASAAAVSRVPNVNVTDGTDVLWSVCGSTAQTSNQVITYGFSRLCPLSFVSGVLGRATVFLPIIPVLGGQTLRVTTTNIDAADQYSAILIYVYQVEWRKMLGGDAHSPDAATWRRQYTTGLLREVD